VVTATVDAGETLLAMTNLAGGWAIKAGTAGIYQVTASGGQFSGAAEQAVVVGNGSVALDFISGRASGIVEFGSPRITAPSGLAATVQAANRVRLAWTDQATTETAYRIERATDGVSFSTLANLPANSTSFQDVGLQSNITYSYRVRAIGLQVQSDPSNVATATPQLITITGTSGNDTYHVIRAGSQLQIYENTAPSGRPTYFSELAAMGGALTINSLEGNDTLTVSTSGEPLGIGQLIYNAGAGGNSLVAERGSARIESTAIGGTLNTTVNAGANLSTARLQQNNLTLGENSKVTLLPGGGTSVITSLTASPSSTLDIGNGAIVINYGGATPVAAMRARILAGRGGPGLGASWTGAGITSSAAAQANATDPEAWSVGYAENAALPLGAYASFRGVTVDATSVLIAYTRTGDANLDGLVNDDDVTIVGATYAPATAQAHWALGDFDYNGFVADDDVTLLGVFYQPGAGAAPAPFPQHVNDGGAGRERGDKPEATESMGSGEYRELSTQYPPRAVIAVVRSAGRPAPSTVGLSRPKVTGTFGQDLVWGSETRALPPSRETRAQQQAAVIDLLAEAIAANESTALRTRLRVARPQVR
jgi:hypothetical protein